MKILQIANKATYPPDGGTIAVLNLAKAYAKNGHSVKILNMCTHKHWNNKNILDFEYAKSIEIKGIEVNSKISILKLFVNFIFSNKAYIAERFQSKQFSSELIKIIRSESFDFIQVEGLFVLQYIDILKENYKGKIVYRPHNAEFIIWKRNYKKTKNILKKIYFKSIYKRLKNLELSLLNSYDYIIPISDTDAGVYNKIANTKPLFIAPFGIDTEQFEKRLTNSPDDSQKSINFIGALDWIPNQEGLVWFIEKCFPLIQKEIAGITLNIAGRNAPQWLIAKFKKPDIIFYGEVENAYAFMQNNGPLIAPLFASSGMRVKIIEGMAMKKSIIATSIAAEGIECTNGQNILLADNAELFAEQAIYLLKNPEQEKKIAENAFIFVKENFDFKKIAADIINFINK